MKSLIKRRIVLTILTVFLISYGGVGRAAGDVPLDSFVIMPIRTINVKGDAAKFRAINWKDDGTTGGILDMSLDRKVNKDVSVSYDGHAILGDADVGNSLTITNTKGNGGYMKMDYGTFRKWYDNTGGDYPAYNTLKVNDLANNDLHVDIGHLLLEVGMGGIDDPTLSFAYERDTKTGDKSRLSWTSVYDQQPGSGAAYVQRKIGPSWEGMDQTTDTLTAKSKSDVAGFTLRTNNQYEFFSADNTREYQGLSTSATASQKYNIRQDSQPQTKLMTSSLLADRWSLNDETYVSVGYRYGHNRSSEDLTLRTYTPANVLAGTLYKDGYALNKQDTNTWTGQMMHSITEDLTFDTKLKGEYIVRRSSGDYFSDTTATPDNIWNVIDANIVENKITRTGESASLRYNGIAKTSLYTEFEMLQENNWLSEARNQTAFQGSTATSVSREEIARNPVFIETIGARYVPTKTINMTTQYKHTFAGQTFNTLWKSDSNPLNRNSFFNKMNIDKDEFTHRVAWKPVKWLENSFRNKVINYTYHTNAVGEDWEKSQMKEVDYVVDTTLMPTDMLMFNLSFTLQQLQASTPKEYAPDYFNSSADYNLAIPAYNADVYTWMLSTSYAPKDNLSLFSALEYSKASNANNDYTVIGVSGTTAYTNSLRYGVDNEWWDITAGLRWTPKKDLEIGPHYGYYSFQSSQSVESGNYSANVFWLDTKLTW